MPSRLFVGNLSYEATEAEIREHFSQVAPVSRVFLPLDRDSGRPRGFAFIEFIDAEHAAAAIEQLHEKPFMDRPLVVNEARPSDARPSGGGSRASGSLGPPGAFRPGPRERTTLGGAPEAPATARRSLTSKSRRRTGRRSPWEETPRKAPIPEKRRSQMFAGEDDFDESEEDIDFENFATGLPESDDED